VSLEELLRSCQLLCRYRRCKPAFKQPRLYRSRLSAPPLSELGGATVTCNGLPCDVLPCDVLTGA